MQRGERGGGLSSAAAVLQTPAPLLLPLLLLGKGRGPFPRRPRRVPRPHENPLPSLRTLALPQAGSRRPRPATCTVSKWTTSRNRTGSSASPRGPPPPSPTASPPGQRTTTLSSTSQVAALETQTRSSIPYEEATMKKHLQTEAVCRSPVNSTTESFESARRRPSNPRAPRNTRIDLKLKTAEQSLPRPSWQTRSQPRALTPPPPLLQTARRLGIASTQTPTGRTWKTGSATPPAPSLTSRPSQQGSLLRPSRGLRALRGSRCAAAPSSSSMVW